MDKKSIIGLVIIGALLVGYSIFNKPQKAELAEQKRIQDSISQVEAIKDSIRIVEAALSDTSKQESSIDQENLLLPEVKDSINKAQLAERLGAFADAVNGKDHFVTIENNLIILTVSNRGGRIYSVELKDYKRHDGTPVVLFDGDSTVFGIELMLGGKPVFTNDLYFEALEGVEHIDATTSEKELHMQLKADNDRYIEFVYTIQPDEYMLDFDIKFNNMEDIISNNISYGTLYWSEMVPAQEKGRKWEMQNTSIHLKLDDDEIEKLAERKDEDDFSSNGKLHWIAFKQQFFSSVLIAEEFVEDPEVKMISIENDSSKYLKYFTAQCTFPVKHVEEHIIPFKFYFGPNQFNTLKQYDIKLEKLVPLGWGIFGWFNRFLIIPLFNWLGGFISNYGLIILLLTIIIKLMLFPLTYKSYLSTAKMRVLKPQIDELSKKYPKGKDMEKQQATMALYKKAGANPMGGCLPMVLQFPILIAMFRFFPASIELRQQSFLWATDLSTYDAVFEWSANIPLISSIYGNHISLFTILMAISMLISTHISSSNQATGGQPGMKMMMYMMPVMMLFWFNSYASGLSYYYFLANVFTIGQTWIIRRFFVDEGKVLARLEQNKKKPVKKSTWQKRLEDAAKKKGGKTKK